MLLIDVFTILFIAILEQIILKKKNICCKTACPCTSSSLVCLMATMCLDCIIFFCA